MDEIRKVLAGPVEKELDGRKIKFAQLTFHMLGEFARWAEGKYDERRQAEIKERLGELDTIADLSPFDRGKLGLEVYASARPFDLVEAMYRMDGAVEVLTLSAQVHDPKMTAEIMGKLLPFDIPAVQALINELTPIGPATPEEQRTKKIRAARGRLESAAAEKNTKAGDKLCRVKLAEGIKMLYVALDESPPDAPSPPAEPASA